MLIKVERELSDADSTVSVVSVDYVLFCYGLEDEFRTAKVAGKTRIPAGEYKVGVRTVGGFHNRYLSRFPSFHKGMLHIQEVPGFEYILIHCGNDHEDTAGCLLLGADAITTYGAMRLVNSTAAYERLYKHVIQSALDGKLEIVIEDNDL